MGYIGPRTTPMNDIASAFSMSDGMNHTVSSELYGSQRMKKEGWNSRAKSLRDYEDTIHIDGPPFANLQTRCD